MMNLLKKYLVLTISTALALILLAAVGSRLFFVMKSYQKEKQELNAAQARLEQLRQRETFPSAANISRDKEKLTDLIDEYNELNGWLSADQIQPEAMEAADFMPFLENTLRRIRDRLQAGRVIFPDKYAFGFEKYAGGQLPASRDIPRLLQQLKITERICQLLSDAAVSELASFARDEFESAPGASAEQAQVGRRQKPRPPGGPESGQSADQLCATQHFKMAFRAREGSTFDLLNRLARLPLFIAVTWVEINNQRQETTSAAVAVPTAPVDKTKATAKNQPEETSREKRIVLGREEVEVKLEMDVYNFEPSIDFREGRAAKTTAK